MCCTRVVLQCILLVPADRTSDATWEQTAPLGALRTVACTTQN